eukprot:1160887-Pelagomonas_calceolata.AAC.8
MDLWWWKFGFTPRLIRHVCPNWHLLNSSATETGYQKNPNLKGASWGTPMHRSMQKTGNFRPQLTPFDKFFTL